MKKNNPSKESSLQNTSAGSPDDSPQGHDDPMIFPLDEFDAGGPLGSNTISPTQPTQSTSSTQPSFTYSGKTKAGKSNKKTPASSSNPTSIIIPTRRRSNRTAYPPQSPPKKKGSSSWIFWLCVLGGLYYFGGNKGCFNFNSTSGQLAQKKFNDFRSGKPILHIDSSNANMFDPEQGGVELKGDVIILEKSGDQTRRYFLPKGVRKKGVVNTKRGKKTTRPIYVGMTESIQLMIDIGSEADSDVMLQDLGDQSVFFVPLNKVEYYDEIEVEVMLDDINDYKEGKRHRLKMPLFLYELLIQGMNTSEVSLEDIPSYKAIEPIED